MKKTIASALFAILVMAMNLGAQTTPEQIAQNFSAVGGDPAAVEGLPALVAELLAKPADQRSGEETFLLWRVGVADWKHPLARQVGEALGDKNAFAGYKWTAQEIRDNAFGKPGDVYPDAVWTGKNRLNDSLLWHDYIASLLGKGISPASPYSSKYAEGLGEYLKTLPDAERLVVLSNEIKGLLGVPASPARDAMIVELRSQRLVLKELME